MKLWILSDLHADKGIEDIAVHAPDFDVLVCAGDMLTGDIAGSIEMTAAIARGKPAIFVAGNHEWMTAADMEEVLDEAHATARREGVQFLECDSVEVGGVTFAGATLWTPDDVRFRPSMDFLERAGADVVITHFEPPDDLLLVVGAKLWVYGHHHGHFDRAVGITRVVRNARGYWHESTDGAVREDYVVEV